MVILFFIEIILFLLYNIALEMRKTMKNYKKVIIDLDYTLLIPDWSKEDEFLKARIPKEEQEEFFKQKQDILDKYEFIFPRYDAATLSEFFGKHGFTVTEKVIKEWMEFNGQNIIDKVAPGAIELLSYLKEHGVEVVILTSWFGATQRPRIKRAGLEPYVDKLITGDEAMKPDLESFYLAIGNNQKDDCLMVGDSPKSDLAGAQNAGIDCYLVDKEHSLMDLLLMFKREVESSIHLAKRNK